MSDQTADEDDIVPVEGEEGPEVEDQPLGPPPDLDPEDAPAPGLPESEPPNSG